MESSREAAPGRPRVRLPQEVRVVNVGLTLFGEAVRAQGAQAIDVDWRIPAGGDPELVAALSRLWGPRAERVDAANDEVVRRLDHGTPMLLRVGTALEDVPGMEDRMILHPGPPLDWEEFCDPLRRSVRATVVAEGWATSPEQAEERIRDGWVRLEPANHHNASIPMASALGPSAPVFVVENPQGGNLAYSGINQGPGRTPWFGVEEPEAIERLSFLREAVGPVLREVIEAAGTIDLLSLVAQGLQMGDDAHMRTQATTNLLIRHLLPHLVDARHRARTEVAMFLSRNHLFFLNLAMAAAKALVDWAAAVPYSSVVVGMARNGTTFGVRIPGAGDRWFVAPAPPVGMALYHAGFGPEDSALDIGDSAVLELVGLGGAAAAASPSLASFIGGTMTEAVAATEAVQRICVGSSGRFRIPFLDFRGSPLGIDVRRVVETGITPAINTGILHVCDGTGQVGAGVARAPIECFQQALLALDAALR